MQNLKRHALVVRIQCVLVTVTLWKMTTEALMCVVTIFTYNGGNVSAERAVLWQVLIPDVIDGITLVN